ncbi:MAG: 30S ribosomal protein S17 [Candidatus Moranbacteria bacterium]|nr:30S ribosomal protein S17 [Candidatus Moranbacteria bacterium]
MTNTIKKLATKTGKVVSDSMDKTLVVAVESLKTHPKYLKKYRSTKKYKVHDGENKHKVGDVVKFVQCRPMSKDKNHVLA